jgi:hypothetical protein
MFKCVLLNFRQEIWPEQFETIPETFSEIQNRKKRTAFYWLIVAILIAMPSVAHIFASPFFMYSNQHKMSNISECTNSNTNNIKSNLSTEIDLNETKVECSSTPSNDFVMSKTLWNDMQFFGDAITEVLVKKLIFKS